jgi:hypothetical protein
MHTIQIIGLASGGVSDPTKVTKLVEMQRRLYNKHVSGKYLEKVGDIDDWRTWEFTEFEADALHFSDAFAGFAFYNQQSTTDPMRPDGKPNRPLTMFAAIISRHSIVAQ